MYYLRRLAEGKFAVTYKDLYGACFVAVQALGPDIKKMSWFKRNWKKPPTRAIQKPPIFGGFDF